MSKDIPKYLNARDFKPGRAQTLRIRAIERETIDGRPQLVMYFEGEERGLPLTKELADDIGRCLGPCPVVEDFFRTEGALH